MATSTTPSVELLIRENLPLVHYAVHAVASRIPRHVCRDDLVSAGMLGLVQAAQSFDASRGIAFDKFAMIRIRGALLDELRERDWATRSVRSMSRRMDSAADTLRARTGECPSKEAIAEEMGVSPRTVQRVRDDVHRATVLNYEALIDGDADDLLPDEAQTPQETILDRELNAYLMDAIVALPERLRTVVVGSFFDERPLREIAEELGVTESRVSQIRAQALSLLRSAIDANLEPMRLAPEPLPEGRAAKRRAAYYAAVGSCSTPQERLDAERGSRERMTTVAAS